MDVEELITDKDIIMRGGAGPPAPPNYNIPPGNDNANLDATLFQILEAGVNNIVEQIKLKLGNDIATTNTNAKAVMELLNGITNQINGNDGINKTGTDGNNTQIRIRKILGTGKYEVNAFTNGYYSSDAGDATTLKTQVDNKEYTTTNNGRKIDMSTLDSKYNNYLNNDPLHITANPDVINEDDNFNITDENNRNRVENRLANCQLLEMLYMIKHEELMKTFAFTLNLFDKYKYAIKIMLFLLKNLVRKQPGTPAPAPTGTPPATGAQQPINIKLPKALIPNIKKLLEDQEKVQDIITHMQDTMSSSSNTILNLSSRNPDPKNTALPRADAKLEDLSSGATSPPNDNQITTNLDTTTTPP